MSFFRRALLAFAVLFFIATLSATAQVSVYGAPMLTRFGFNSQYGGFGYENFSAGIGGGAFYNFPIHSRLTAGIDVRGSASPGSRGGESFAAALRIGFVPTEVRLRPYFQLGGGVVSAPYQQTYGVINGNNVSTYTTSSRKTNGAAELMFGLDVRITPQVDWRAIEYGGIFPTSNGQDNAGVGYLDSGVVYHFR